jgi:plasmid stability protein
MPNLLLRNLDRVLLDRLKSEAAANGRSLQSEIHRILQQASAHSLARTRRISAQWLKRLHGTTHSDSTELIREDRDRR